jgi:hypothetical protein
MTYPYANGCFSRKGPKFSTGIARKLLARAEPNLESPGVALNSPLSRQTQDANRRRPKELKFKA